MITPELAWVHWLCGATAWFPEGVDPNQTSPPCPHCLITTGRWAPA